MSLLLVSDRQALPAPRRHAALCPFYLRKYTDVSLHADGEESMLASLFGLFLAVSCTQALPSSAWFWVSLSGSDQLVQLSSRCPGSQALSFLSTRGGSPLPGVHCEGPQWTVLPSLFPPSFLLPE